jgi:hypothetical protein
MLRIDWVNHRHKNVVTLLNFDVVSIKFEVVVKGRVFTLRLLWSSSSSIMEGNAPARHALIHDIVPL